MSLLIDLLLAHADDHRPVLEESLPASSALGMEDPGDPKLCGRMRHDGADPNALPLQRWGVIAPEGPSGDRLLALIDPLICARRQAQGQRRVLVERVPVGVSAARARAWRRERARATATEDQPRYLLFLGDLDQVSLELQQVLSIDAFTGRLAFREEEGYAAYVEKVLRWEQAAPTARARALFCTVADGSLATSVGHAALMRPVRARCVEQQALGSFAAGAIEELASDPRDALLGAAAKGDPSVLFSMSHGLGAPSSGWATAERQRALQGAMHLGRGASITAEDLAGRSFLPSGVWFFFACFSAGTPARSVYHPWLHRIHQGTQRGAPIASVLASLPREGDRPFVAALPQAVLASPEGPLAVIGHVDLAWSYSFQDPAPFGFTHPGRFYAVLRSLCDGVRVGVAHAEITRFLIETSVDLSAFYDEDAQAALGDHGVAAGPAREIEKAHMWMRRHDLGGYLLLGDPAVRLPIAEGAAT